MILRKPNPNKIHFLHIGKTGGTAIREALMDVDSAGEYELILHSHGVSLKDVPRGEKVVIFLREPISRFVSGFYSRKRKGLPRYLYEWNDVEAEIFPIFDTPNELAMALAEKNSEFHSTALKAMKNVKHLEHFNKWLISKEYLDSRREDVFFIGFQESLDQNFEELKKKLNLGQDISLPNDDVGAHRNSGELDKSLTTAARRRLEEWYAEDIIIIDFCRGNY